MDHSPTPQSRATHAAGIPGRVSPRADADFLTLFETARPQMWLIAAGVTGNRSEADDVLQDAAMIAMRKFATFEPGTNFNAWMAEVTRNTARNARRKHLRAHRLTQSVARLLSPAQHTPTAPRTSREDLILNAVRSLEEVPRTCLLLRVVGGLSYESIAIITQIPEGTAMSHVFRAREKLRSHLATLESAPAASTRVSPHEVPRKPAS
jgi:RNA polymerase sigma-70 factor (ECF subfamily)